MVSMGHLATQVAKTLASSMPSVLIQIVLDYSRSFEVANYRNCTSGSSSNNMGLNKVNKEESQNNPKKNNLLLVFTNDRLVQSTARAFAVRMSDGSVNCWGDPKSGGDCSSVQAQLKDVKAICGAWGGAFAAIVGNDNRVICWGNELFGGDCSGVSELRQVEALCGSFGAFAALKRDGTVTTWGRTGGKFVHCLISDKDYGADSSSVQSRLKGVKAISSTLWAFAAVLADGTVEAWGNQVCGGLIPPSVKERLKQVQCITGSDFAFAALLSDGTVETWGSEDYGGDRSHVACELKQVEHICATRLAFTAVIKDGTVVSWGAQGFGADFRVRGWCWEMQAIGAAGAGFTVARNDGMRTWGCVDRLAEELKEVVAIRGTGDAFAALRKDGTVVTWGKSAHGGDSSAVRDQLKGVVALSATSQAFAAQRSDGTVVFWGDKGEDPSPQTSSPPTPKTPQGIRRKGGCEIS